MTMIELLVTIVVMGLAFSVIVGGLGISIVGSDTNRRQATAETVLLNLAEKVRSAETVYEPDCDAATTAYESAFTPVAGYVSEVISVSPADSENASQFQACTGPGAPEDKGLQLVVLSVTSEERPTTRTVQVVKRQP